MFRNIGLRARLVLSGILVLLLGLGLSGGYAVVSATSQAEKDAQQLLQETAKTNAEIVRSFINPAVDIAETIAHMVEGGKASGLPRSAIGGLVVPVVKAHPLFAGCTVAFEPNGYDGKDAEFKGQAPENDAEGRFVPYYYNKSDGTVGIDPLVMTIEAGIEGWYNVPLANNRTTIVSPYIYPIEGVDVLMSTISVPMKDAGKGYGIATIDIKLVELTKTLNELYPLGEGRVMLISGDGIWASHHDEKLLGQTIAEKDPVKGLLDANEPIVEVVGGNYYAVAPIKFGAAEEVWKIVISVPKAKVLESARNLQWTMIIVVFAVLLIGVIIFALVGSRIARPIVGLAHTTAEIANGNLDAKLTGDDRGDEIGELARAVAVLKEGQLERRRLEADQKAAAERLEQEKHQAMMSLADRFEATVKRVVEHVGLAAKEMQANAQAMSSTAEDAAQRISAASGATVNASGNVQAVAAAAEELSSSISEISRQVATSSEVARSAVGEIGKANETMKGLVEVSNRIGDVVKLINEVAEQTNLLALNATIEAARAGEAGKGFAVVANEVKQLASQTTKATDEIAGQIQAIQSSTGGVAKAMESVTATIQKIDEISSSIAAAVEEQSAATREISGSVQQAASGTTAVSDNIGGVERAVQSSRETAVGVLSAARELADQANVLTREVDAFISQVRRG